MNNVYNSEMDGKDIGELAKVLGVSLDAVQLNVGGERAVMSPHKFVLTGRMEKTGQRVVLKCATHPSGVAEIVEEHAIRETLGNLPFAEQELLMPAEIYFGTRSGHTVLITEFIEQPHVFTDYDLQQQFFMALQALEAQESFHATTREHHASILKQFHRHDPHFYVTTFADMQRQIERISPQTGPTLSAAASFLTAQTNLLHTYDGYLMHSDFVPHNFRINDRRLYLLDFVSFTLGNKYESWARFINFMEIHSPSLVPLLLNHILRDRSAEEYLALRLMRVYKITFLLNYYAQTLTKTTGDLHTLTQARIELWIKLVTSVLADQPIAEQIIRDYHQRRSALRTPEEKDRQRQFTWA